MVATMLHFRSRCRRHLPACLGLLALLASSVISSGCATTRQTRYSLQDEPQASTWTAQTQDQVWMELYTGDSAASEQE